MPPHLTNHVAVIGLPKSGKSTIANLLVRRRLFPVSSQDLGAFGVTALAGRHRCMARPRDGGRPIVIPLDARDAIKHEALDTLRRVFWIERGGIPEDVQLTSVSEVPILGRGEGLSRRWCDRAQRELQAADHIMLVVPWRGVGTEEVLRYRDFFALFPIRQPPSCSTVVVNTLTQITATERAAVARATHRHIRPLNIFGNVRVVDPRTDGPEIDLCSARGPHAPAQRTASDSTHRNTP